MKKRVFYACFCVVMAFALNACSDSCKTCTRSTYDADGGVISAGTPQEYCGAELLLQEAMDDVEVNGIVTKTECY